VNERAFVVKKNFEQMFALPEQFGYSEFPTTPARLACRPLGRSTPVNDTNVGGNLMSESVLSRRQRQVLVCIEQAMRDRGYPPSVREIGQKVGLSSSSTVHAHLNSLEKMGFLKRDPTKPRAIEVRWDPMTDTTVERRPVRHVPLIGDVAAGIGVLSEERVEELLPLPEDFTGEGTVFMLRVRGDSMINAGILDGDYVVVRQGEVRSNDIVVAGIPGEEATVKTYQKDGRKITLIPHNPTMKPMTFDMGDITLYGRVVTVLRRLD
jgi:repressor LexA